ncbi:MAG: hypothetical protein KBD63_04210 [Bacteriovoracaceae bacterium]|nr:hypothetical protein [Bacteriovoracaceae bacterium]
MSVVLLPADPIENVTLANLSELTGLPIDFLTRELFADSLETGGRSSLTMQELKNKISLLLEEMTQELT